MRTLFGEFGAAARGNVGMMTAVLSGVLLVGAGAALDFSSAAKRNSDLQAFADAAVLAAAKSREDNLVKLQKIAEKIVAEHNTDKWPLTVQVSYVGDDIAVEVLADYDTMIMGIIGQDQMPVNVVSRSPKVEPTPINIALVLDTTTSMEGTGIEGLRAAASDLLDELDEFDSDVAVSIVPFAQYVNVGLGQRGQAWLDIDEDGETETKEHCWDETTVVTQGECTGTGKMITYDDIRDGRDFGKKTREEQHCTPTVREPTGRRLCEMRTTTKTWYGCMGSRQAPYNVSASYGGRRLPGVMNVGCGTEVTPLSQDLQSLKGEIDALTTNGNTYMPSGLMWGWRMLDESQPFTKPAAIKAREKKGVLNALIFMTDGENTLSQGGSEPHLHGGSDEEAANVQTLALCEAIRAEGVQIFTIGYRMGAKRKDSKDLLRACAGSKANFYNAENTHKLKKAFNDIAESLDYTRLSY